MFFVIGDSIICRMKIVVENVYEEGLRIPASAERLM